MTQELKGIIVLTNVHKLEVDSVDIGYLRGEVSMEKNIDANPIMVDQVKADVFHVASKSGCTLAATLAQATLDNLKIVWNESAAIASIGSPLSTQTLPGGIVNALPIREVIFTGTFVRPDETEVDRVITCFKCQNFGASSIAHPVSDMVLVPVTFTLIPDTTKATGQEFFTIVDTEK